jgi:hypothetical protein
VLRHTFKLMRRARLKARAPTCIHSRPIYPTDIAAAAYCAHMHRPRPSSHHRLARFIAWALMLLHWIATGLDHGTPADRRRLKQRDWFLDTGNLFRLVRDLILWRAGVIAKLPAPPRIPHRGVISAQIRRRAFGSRLRRALHHRDLRQMLARLTRALAHIDHYARPLAKRFKRRLTRLSPHLPAPQPADAFCVLAEPARFAADSS